MSRWGNSRQLTAASYGLVKDHPGMYRWTVRAAVLGAIVGGIGALVGVGLIVAGVLAVDRDKEVLGALAAVLGCLVLIAGVIAGLTAANRQLAGLVRTADDVLHGRPIDEHAARAAVRPHLRTLAAWSTISAAVGALGSFIQGDDDSGMVASIVRGVLAGLVATVWSVATTLVLPVIVLEHLGAIDAIKRSAGIIRSTWGESVYGNIRIGARFGLTFTLPGILLVAGGVALCVAVDGAVGIVGGGALVLVGVVLIVIGAVKVATCPSVFGVALYRWATGEGALGPFTDADLRDAVGTRAAAAIPA
jgi:hypothetical protein